MEAPRASRDTGDGVHPTRSVAAEAFVARSGDSYSVPTGTSRAARSGTVPPVTGVDAFDPPRPDRCWHR